MSDNKTTIQELKDIVKKFSEERDWDQFDTAKEMAICLCTEAAELLDHFRFQTQAEADKMLSGASTRMEIEHELSDVLYDVLRFAQFNNIDLSDAFKRKLELNRKKYPVSKAKGSHKKWDEL